MSEFVPAAITTMSAVCTFGIIVATRVKGGKDTKQDKAC